MIGRTLGSYRIIEQIGMGGMATVYRAYDPGTDRDVALKVLPEYHSHDPTFRERFRREARAIAALEHTHILPVYAFGEEDGIAYLVMRYLPGGTLASRITGGPLPLDEAARLLGQLAAALDYAHRRGVLHRDVKPSNVLLDAEGNVFLMDFGIARMVQAEGDLTGSGLIGTPQYMSPEQCQGARDLSPASDQYALGVILYEMVTGQRPFQAETPMAVIMMQLQDPLPPPRSLRPDLPDAAERAILKALAKAPTDRFPTCSALADAFAKAVGTAAGMATVQALPPEADFSTQPAFPAAPGRQRPILIGVLATAAAAILIAALAILLPGSRSPGAQRPPETEAPAADPTEAAPTSAVEPIAQARTATSPPSATPASTPTPVPDPPAAGWWVEECDGDLCRVDGQGVSAALGLPAGYLNVGKSGFSLSPDGSQIVFSGCSREELAQDPTYDFCHDLYLVGVDGVGVQRLFQSQNYPEAYPAWSPDGEWIAFGGWSLALVRPDGTGQTKLVADEVVGNVQSVAWSPDSARLAYTSGEWREDLNFGFINELSVINRDGSGWRTIFTYPEAQPTDADWIVQIAWSPDGAALALQFGDGSAYQIDPDCTAGAPGCLRGDLTPIAGIPHDWLHTFHPQWSGAAGGSP